LKIEMNEVAGSSLEMQKQPEEMTIADIHTKLF